MNIRGKKITLRAIEKDDCRLIVEMFNDPEMENLVVGWSFPLSEFSQEKWIEEHYRDQHNLRFVIENEQKETLGIATLVEIDWKNRSAVQAIKPEYRSCSPAAFAVFSAPVCSRYRMDT